MQPSSESRFPRNDNENTISTQSHYQYFKAGDESNNSTQKNDILERWRFKNWQKIPIKGGHINETINTIQKYGIQITTTTTCVQIRHGAYILEIYSGFATTKNKYMALYEGNIDDFMIWFEWYTHANYKLNLSIFKSNINLLKAHNQIKGINSTNVHEYSATITNSLIKYGWLQGLKYLIENLQLNYINNNFELLADAAWHLHDDILKYLLIENNFYKPFDIKSKTNQFNETLWMTAKKKLINIIELDHKDPQKGWLHVLESLNYAPCVINAIHGNYNTYDYDAIQVIKDQPFEDQTIINELNDINFDCSVAVLSSHSIEERLYTINTITANENRINVLIESCYYGFCMNGVSNFCRPQVVKDNNYAKLFYFVYIPGKNKYGNLKCVENGLYLTLSDDKKSVVLNKLKFNNDGTQLWTIERVNILNGIWIQIFNKCKYKLMISWENDYKCKRMPSVTVSENVCEIDSLCRDIFSVAPHYKSTLHYQYYEQYHHYTKRSDLRRSRYEFTKFRLWNLPNNVNKFDIYKQKLKNIAAIIEQYHQMFIQTENKPNMCENANDECKISDVTTTTDESNNNTQQKRVVKKKRRSKRKKRRKNRKSTKFELKGVEISDNTIQSTLPTNMNTMEDMDYEKRLLDAPEFYPTNTSRTHSVAFYNMDSHDEKQLDCDIVRRVLFSPNNNMASFDNNILSQLQIQSDVLHDGPIQPNVYSCIRPIVCHKTNESFYAQCSTKNTGYCICCNQLRKGNKQQGSTCGFCNNKLAAKYHMWYPNLIHIEPLQNERTKILYIEYKPLFRYFGITWSNNKELQFVIDNFMLVKIFLSSKQFNIDALHLERTCMVGIYSGKKFKTENLTRQFLQKGCKLFPYTSYFTDYLSQFAKIEVCQQMNKRYFGGVLRCYFYVAENNRIEGFYDPNRISALDIDAVFKDICKKFTYPFYQENVC
eukprot:342589_1